MLSKLAGIVLIFSYILSTRLPVSEDVSFLIWLGFLLMLVLAAHLSSPYQNKCFLDLSFVYVYNKRKTVKIEELEAKKW